MTCIWLRFAAKKEAFSTIEIEEGQQCPETCRKAQDIT
jgi:hypothetical protein